MGRFCKEKQYADDLEKLLKIKKIPFEREKDVQEVNPYSPNGNRSDFIIDRRVVIDYKAKAYITKQDYDQMQRYLHAANIELGLIVNMRNYNLRPKRILNPEFHIASDNSDNHSDH